MLWYCMEPMTWMQRCSDATECDGAINMLTSQQSKNIVMSCPIALWGDVYMLWWGSCVWLRDGERKHVKVCACMRVCGSGWACVPVCVCNPLVGPGTTAQVGAIIRSAVISINTFLDAHTLSQQSGAQHPPRRWPAACRHMAASQALITTRQPVG